MNHDPIGETGGINLYLFALNDPVHFIDPIGESIFSRLGTIAGKKAAKKLIKDRIKKHIIDRLKDIANKKTRKKLLKEAEEIIDVIDSEWWEVCIGFIPIAGDVYDIGSLTFKIRKALRKADRLADKIDRSISKKKPKLKAKERRTQDRARTAAEKAEKTPGGYDANKIIDDITKSEKNLEIALERVRLDPSRENLEALEDAQKQLSEIKNVFDELRRRGRKFCD